MDLHKQGVIVAAQSRATAEEFLTRIRPLSEFGYDVPDRTLDQDELRGVEPGLGDAVRAGVRVMQHWHVKPESMTAGLARALRAMRGVEIFEETEVIEFETSTRRVRKVHLPSRVIEADIVVLAAGAWSPLLARRLGLPLPMQAGKGYSFSARPQVLPRHSLLLAEPHVACSPFGDRLRVAGTMEFSGVNARVDPNRLATIISGASGMLQPWHTGSVKEVWTGLRPIAPDGLPIIGRMPGYENGYLATAYSMLGMTLAAPAAEALTEMILSGEEPDVLAPFTVSRFASTRTRRVRR
jgi:D-amino-acid dehydrogenase